MFSWSVERSRVPFDVAEVSSGSALAEMAAPLNTVADCLLQRLYLGGTECERQTPNS